MKIILLLAAVFCFATVNVAEELAADDFAVKEQLRRANKYRHDDVRDDCRRHAFVMAGQDTNRFCRILKELAIEDLTSASVYVWMIGEYGGTNELEYIYGILASTNATSASKGAAAKTVLRLDMPSIRGIESLGAFVGDVGDAAVIGDQGDVILEMRARFPDLSGDRLHEWNRSLLRFATNRVLRCAETDGTTRTAMPAYEMSRQRLSTLRSARDLGAYRDDPRVYCWLTNEIYRLESCPEPDLVNLDDL